MVEDSKSVWTKWLTGPDDPDTKTRMMIAAQLEWTFAQQLMGSAKGLDIPHCALMAEIDMRLMMSLKGLSREEAVEALKSMEQKPQQNVGLAPLKDYKDTRERAKG